MADFQTPNLPSRDFDRTIAFYEALGFMAGYRSEGWMILERGSLMLEFFHFPDHEPASSNFMCCLRLDDLAAFYDVCRASGIEEKCLGAPRLHPPQVEDWGGTRAALIDPDGTLIHLIQNS